MPRSNWELSIWMCPQVHCCKLLSVYTEELLKSNIEHVLILENVTGKQHFPKCRIRIAFQMHFLGKSALSFIFSLLNDIHVEFNGCRSSNPRLIYWVIFAL